MGRIIIPFLIGAVKASAMTITLGTIKLAALKAFFISKVALVVSIVIIFAKFWKKTEYLEVEELGTQQYPVYDFSGTGKYSILLLKRTNELISTIHKHA